MLAYVFLLALLRLSGKHELNRAPPFDFILVLILGDLIDDALWAEVPFAQFVVAAATLVLARLASSLLEVPRRA